MPYKAEKNTNIWESTKEKTREVQEGNYCNKMNAFYAQFSPMCKM